MKSKYMFQFSLLLVVILTVIGVFIAMDNKTSSPDSSAPATEPIVVVDILTTHTDRSATIIQGVEALFPFYHDVENNKELLDTINIGDIVEYNRSPDGDLIIVNVQNSKDGRPVY